MKEDVVSQFDALTSMEDAAQLKRLDELLCSLSPQSVPPGTVDALLRLFERFPESDGFGLFWSIVHFLETCDGFESALLQSVRRVPTEFNLLMLNRLINGGVREIDGTVLLEILDCVATDESVGQTARQQAANLASFQHRGGLST